MQPPTAPKKGRPNIYDAIFQALRNIPGEWDVIATGQANGTQVSRLRAVYPGFEVIARRNAEGTFDLYARFIGVGGLAA